MNNSKYNELVTAGHIAQAMVQNKDKFTQAADGYGALELTGAATQYAPIIEACAQALTAKFGQDFPGVRDCLRPVTGGCG